MSHVVATGQAIANRLRPGQMIILESSTYPGTTEEILRPILEQSGLKSDRDFFLAYSPEREDPGNVEFGTARIPKVVGGDGEAALGLAIQLYDQVVAHTVPASSMRVAEAVKLTENIFRSVNIALVNELKIVFNEMGIDIWEVIEAAKTKPFGYMPFYPGPGLGGHCIPIDPFYLTWKAREYGVATRFIELAGEINTAMPRYVAARLADALNRQAGKAVRGAKILIVGIAYKKNIDDVRESPGLEIIDLLEAKGALVAFHDPLVAEIPPSRRHGGLTGRKSLGLRRDTINDFDAALICTDHDNIDYRLIAEACPIVVDCRNAMARAGIEGAHIVKA
jgi:UDP-N-acetyl-D-glucosamine dehydrogenase